MYLRKSVTKHGGKNYSYWQLVESVRTERGIRQRVIAHLGNLSNFTADQWKELGSKLAIEEIEEKLKDKVKTGKRRGRPPKTLVLKPQVVGGNITEIDLDSISWKDPRDFGDVYAALMMYKRIGFGKLMEEKLQGRRYRGIIMQHLAALIAVARTVAPTSELGTIKWYKTTALPDLLGIPADSIDEDWLYKCLDIMLPHKEEIEKHLKEKGVNMFNQSYRVLLYDISSTYFEGVAEGIPMAKRGYSRDHRPDCKQICFGVTVTTDGWPIGYEIFEGNKRDSQTLEGLLKKLESKFGKPEAVTRTGELERVLVMDRGLMTVDNMRMLKKENYGYIMAERRTKGARWYWEKGKEANWIVIRTGQGKAKIEVQEIGKDGDDRLILVRSEGCREKEKGMHNRVLKRMIEDLSAMEKSLSKGNLKDPIKIQRRLGKLQERYGALWRWVDVKLTEPDNEGRTNLKWEIRKDIEKDMRNAEGVYLLRTNLPKRSAQDLWQDYMRLTEVEAVFRTMKHDLNIRPIFHSKQRRVEAHMLFSFIGYVLYWLLEREHRSRGGNLTGRMLIEALRQVKIGTISMKTSSSLLLTLKRVSTPDRETIQLLNTLNLQLPQPKAGKLRLRVII